MYQWCFPSSPAESSGGEKKNNDFDTVFFNVVSFWSNYIKKCNLLKRPNFSQWPKFMANVAGLSWKELATLTGEQINASKFSNWPVLKGSRNIFWYLYATKSTLIKKKTKYSSYIRKFKRDRVQGHIWGRAPNIWGNAQIFSPYMRRSCHIWLFTRSLWIS